MEGSSLKLTVERLGMRVRFSQDPELTTTKAIQMVPSVDKVEELLRVTELQDIC